MSLIVSLVYGIDERTESIYTGLYLQIWGILFFLSYFHSHKTFFLRWLIWVCEHLSAPRGRKMAFFYFALAFGLGSISIFNGISAAPQEPINEIKNKTLDRHCLSIPAKEKDFSSFDSQDYTSTILLSTSFEKSADLKTDNISPFIQNQKAKLQTTTLCSNSGNYSLNVIPRKSGFFSKIFPPQFDRIKTGTILSSSFFKYEPFNVSEYKSVKLTFVRFSTSNPDKREDFNCGSELNVYYRINGGEWTHKMAYCGQHITETTGWRKSELEFKTEGKSTIDFLFAYESFRSMGNSICYMIDDLVIIGSDS